jgi:phage-related minor tail protein
MGEAGPEAIMPLKRDANGNLGVRASGSETSVQVVVNNHSGQPASATETVDSRGNKKIEVLVGELVAREVSRPNSPINNSMKSNFQVQPTLIRR